MKQICVFLLSMLLTACSAAPDSAELVPYDLSEKEQFVLETFGMLESSQLLSFHAPEEAITLTCEKFIRRFRAMERSALAQGREPDTLTLDEMTVLWNEAKRS